MKLLALKLLTVYVLLFTTISTLLIIYNIRNLTSNNNGNLVLQNIICDHWHGIGIKSPKDHILPNESRDFEILPNRAKYISDESTTDSSLNEIIESIKLNNVYSTLYRDHNFWFTSSKQQFKKNKKFEEPLSFYNGPHHNLIRSLLPAANIRQKPSQNLFHTNNDRIQEQIALKLDRNIVVSRRKLVLMMFDSLDLNGESLLANQCNFKECTFTKSLSEAENADAIIFQNPQKMLRETLNRRKQIWVYHNIESPVHSEQFLPHLKINWTATYRSDSVIPTPYAKFVTFQNTSKLPIKPIRNFAIGKTRLAAVFISNCYTKNERLSYIRHLQRFVHIDLYGKCGDEVCTGQHCFEMLRKNYKFYLAFENSNCRDYITEKFFHNALQ